MKISNKNFFQNFQVRKSLFPPRPRLNKARDSSATKRKMEPQVFEDSDSDRSGSETFPSPNKKKRQSGEGVSSKQEVLPESGGNTNNFLKSTRITENNKQGHNSAGESSVNDKSSSFEEFDGDSDVDAGKSKFPSTSKSLASTSSKSVSSSCSSLIAKIPMTSTSSIEISKSTNSFKDSRSSPDMISISLSSKGSVSEKRKEFLRPINKLLDIDSGCSTSPSSQEMGGSQEFGNKCGLSLSEGFTSHIDEESDDETILKRVDSFSKSYGEHPTTQSQPLIRTESVDLNQHLDENESNLGLCRFCMSNPKNGVFVHNNCLHLCCCYKCAIKVWKKRKSCPICNGKIKNVTKLFVH